MKRLFAFLLLFLVALSLSACTDSESAVQVTEWKPATSPTTTTEAATEEDTVKVIKIRAETDPPAKKNNKEETEPLTQGVVQPGRHIQVTTVRGSISIKDMEFVYKSATVKLNDPMIKVFENLGTDYGYTDLGNGKMEYEYEHFILTSYSDEDDVQRLEQLVLTDSKVCTNKGAKIGNYGTAMRRIYGDEDISENGVMTYNYQDTSLSFSVEDNIITAITYKYYP